MSNYKKLEKSKGILAFASNTDTVDYVSMANRSLCMAARQLNVDYRVITPEKHNTWNNYRYDPDTREPTVWNNHSRWQAYAASPWDQTLVIDADYLVMTDRLNTVFKSSADYLLCFENNIIGNPYTTRSCIDPVWATVFYFQKTSASQALFEMVHRIEQNYQYYRHLFGVYERNFRNDYAFSMADLIINGHTRNPSRRLPFGIVSIDHSVNSLQLVDNKLLVRYDSQCDILPRQDLHVMSKAWMQSKNSIEFMESVQ